MRTFKLFNFNLRSSAMVQADGCTAARQKIGVNPRTTSIFGRFASVLCLILTMLFTLGVGEMWANDYYYRGSKNSWGATAMTVHNSGLYEYYSSSAQSFNGDQFKISKTTSSHDYNCGYVAQGFNGGSSSIGDYGGDNCYIWDGSNGYIIVYYPNTALNTTNNPKITFRTSLYTPTFYIKHTFNGSSWTWGTMTRTGTGVYTYTGNCYTANGANVYTSKSDNNYLSPSGTSGVNNGVPAVWSYNAKSNSLSVAPAYTLTVNNDGHGSASGSVSKGIKMSTKYAISASSPSTGYHFNNWTRVSGGTCTFDNASSASTNVTVTGDASATVCANFALNTYTVVYNANDAQYPGTATGSTSNSSHTYGTAKALTSNGFSRTGYSFAGWATAADGSVAYSDGQSVTNLSSTHGATVTLYAKWTENKSTVTLVASPEGKGTFKVGGETVTSTQAGVTTTPSVTAYPISGYRFTGWSISGGASISSTSDNPTIVTGGGAGTAATLTATFEENLVYYDVTFGVGTSYTSLGSISATNNTTSSAISSGDDLLSASSVTFTASPNSGYQVDGFYSDASCETQLQSGTTTTYTIASLGANVTVYVKFIPITYTITYNLDGGTNHGSNPADYNITTPTITLQNPSKTGYTFAGWYTNAEKTISGNTITNGSTGNKTFWAKWTENMTTVTISASPAGTGTFTVNSVAGSSASVGVTTTKSIVAVPHADYTWTSWTATNCSVSPTNNKSTTLRGNGSSSTGTLVGTFTQVPCTLWYHTSSATFATKTGQIIMSYDLEEDAYYADVNATPSNPYYFRFYHNGATQYSAAWGDGGYPNVKTASANGSKIACDQNVGSWDNKSSIKYVGEQGSKIRIWFDYQNKKTWITASLNNQYVLRGSQDGGGDPNSGMPGWSATDSYFNGLASGNTGTITATLNAATAYKFKVYDMYNAAWKGKNGSGDQAVTNGTYYTLGTGGNFTFTSTIAGTYTFTIDKSSGLKVKVDFPASYQLNYDIGTVKGNDGDISTSPTTASGSYVSSGNSVTLTAPAPKAGYSWKGWYTNAGGTTGHIEDEGRAITVTMNATKTLYACYTENDYTVTVTATAGGSITTPASPATTVTAHPATTAAIVAAEAEGYYFVNWTTEDAGITIASPTSKSTTITATADGTVTANFAELDKIYFRNSSTMSDGAWANVYVYFGVTWNGYENAISNANVAYKVAMTRIGTSDVYWAYVPRAFTSSGGTAIAFSNQSVGTSATINSGLAATRNDYNRALQMYVPSTTWANHGAHYYNDGYWKCYPIKVATGAGYYLQTTRGTNLVEFKGQADNSDKIECTVRVDEHDKDKVFHIKSAGGVYYEPYNYSTSTYPKISSSAPTMTMKSGDTDGLTVTLTSEGIYTFIIDQSASVMELTVGYPISPGDYRLKHTYNSGSKTTYSDVIKSGDAAEGQTLSMYLSTEGSRSLVLQKCTAIVAGSPRWTAGDETNLSGVLSTVGTNGNGVYQFDVKVSADKVASAPTATKYTGSYYIKTDGATGGWANYKQNSMEENTLNYDTDHPEKSFNYYYCKYYGDAGTNLKCVIANDYCNALTDTLVGDAVIGMGNQTTPSAASVRFSYNSYTNEIKRSYLGSSVNSDFLRILGNTAAGKPHIYDKAESTYDDSHADSYITFEDKQNWRYEIDVKADVNARAKLTASFNGQTQYFWGHAGESGHEWDNENTEELFGGESGTYGLTLVYDFKTNKLITAWKPTGATISSDLTLNSDILLLREHQGAPTTITFGQKGGSGDYASLSGVKTVYAVLRLNRWILSNRANSTDLSTDHCSSAALIEEYHPGLSPGTSGYLSQHERELYFISFPFDVKMSDIIDFGGYYDKWGIMYYDGKGRAKNGYWIDSESNWKYFTPEEFATKTLKAYEGYLIGIDLAAMAYNNTSFWTNNSCEVDIYFPSKTDVSSITQKAVDVDIDQTGYLCTINRDFGGDDGDRRIKDSYWHCIGVPSYANLSHEINNGAPDDEDWKNTSLLYLYEWNTETNEHSIMEASSFSFQAMYAYLVQYAGTTLSWAASATGPLPIAARRMKTEELRDRQFDLQLMQGDKEADHTYIRLSDDEEVTTGFEFNHDVSKMMLNGANIYTLIGTEQAAANSLPLNMEQTTVVPVGVKIATTGDYTFSIPEGTEGVGVTLIDNETGARTSLSALDYAIYLEAGTYNERFLLEISPIKLTPTSVDAVTGDGSQITDARKVMIDGLLYIVKDGVIYDARGAMVK